MCRDEKIGESRLSRLALWLFLAGVLMRGLIPVGYMIDYAALENGSSPIVLCPTGLEGTSIYDILTGTGHKHAAHAHGEPGVSGEADRVHHDAPCVFAAVAALAAVLLAFALILSLWPSIRNRLAPENDRRPDGGSPLPIGARAPPLPA